MKLRGRQPLKRTRLKRDPYSSKCTERRGSPYRLKRQFNLNYAPARVAHHDDFCGIQPDMTDSARLANTFRIADGSATDLAKPTHGFGLIYLRSTAR